jgi:hypothetical protein
VFNDAKKDKPIWHKYDNIFCPHGRLLFVLNVRKLMHG